MRMTIVLLSFFLIIGCSNDKEHDNFLPPVYDEVSSLVAAQSCTDLSEDANFAQLMDLLFEGPVDQSDVLSDQELAPWQALVDHTQSLAHDEVIEREVIESYIGSENTGLLIAHITAYDNLATSLAHYFEDLDISESQDLLQCAIDQYLDSSAETAIKGGKDGPRDSCCAGCKNAFLECRINAVDDALVDGLCVAAGGCLTSALTLNPIGIIGGGISGIVTFWIQAGYGESKCWDTYALCKASCAEDCPD